MDNALNRVDRLFTLPEGRVPSKEAAAVLKTSRRRAANLIRIRNRAPKLWLDWVEEGRLTLKHLEAVLTLDARDARNRPNGEKLLRETIAQRWTTSQLREEVRVAKGGRRPDDPHQDADIRRLEQRLSEILATKVMLDYKPNGVGQLILGFTDNETLEGLLARLGYTES